ncbi:MAG: SAM-dependent methyltransferase, partial [Bacteroidales bacterium]|nr:SAM-dependent methyltransferase [Bacteroidales bacterium]
AIDGGQTQIFIETPYRNNRLIAELAKALRRDLRLCVAYDITGADEWIATRTIAEWEKNQPTLAKKPAIFLLYK